jgi:hypothetical protein
MKCRVTFVSLTGAQPPLASFGPGQEAFNNNMHEIMFSWDQASKRTASFASSPAMPIRVVY